MAGTTHALALLVLLLLPEGRAPASEAISLRLNDSMLLLFDPFA